MQIDEYPMTGYGRGQGLRVSTIGDDCYVPVPPELLKQKLARFIPSEFHRGIKICNVTFGTPEDTSLGYIYQKYAVLDGERIYTKPAFLSDQLIHDAKTEFLGNLADPTGQWITVHPPNHCMIKVRPCVFLKMIEQLENGEPVNWDMTFESKEYQDLAGPANLDLNKLPGEGDKSDDEFDEDEGGLPETEDTEDFTARDDEWIKANYGNPQMTYEKMAEALGCDKDQLIQHMKGDLLIYRGAGGKPMTIELPDPVEK